MSPAVRRVPHAGLTQWLERTIGCIFGDMLTLANLLGEPPELWDMTLFAFHHVRAASVKRVRCACAMVRRP
jgi:hypothetical protein